MSHVSICSNLGSFLSAHRSAEWARVASAYLSDLGARELLSGSYDTLEVVAGLNDEFTDPAALRRLHQDAKLRVIRRGNGTRFHPKLYWFETGGRGAVYVGSANLTGSAMSDNAELGMVYEYNKQQLAADVADVWNSWWNEATPATERIIAEYELAYRERQKLERQLRGKIAKPLVVLGEMGEFLAIRARFHGKVRTALQGRAELAGFFGLGRRRSGLIQVTFGGRRYEIKTKINRHGTGEILQINLGHSHLLDVLPKHSRDDLVVFYKRGAKGFDLVLVPATSADARSLIDATGHRGKRPFAAGVGPQRES